MVYFAYDIATDNEYYNGVFEDEFSRNFSMIRDAELANTKGKIRSILVGNIESTSKEAAETTIKSEAWKAKKVSPRKVLGHDARTWPQ